MQWDGDDGIGLGDDLGAGPDHPSGHPAREIEAIAIFEAVHEPPRDIVEDRNGAAAIEGRRVGDRFRRQRALAKIVGEGRAETHAIGSLDQSELVPACRAKRAGIGHALLAGQAMRRQRQIDEVARCLAQFCRYQRQGRETVDPTFQICIHVAPTLAGGPPPRHAAILTTAKPPSHKMPPMSGAIRLFDKALLDRRRRRALRAAVPGGDFLYRLAADEILERLAAVTRVFSVAAEIGSPGTYLADRLTGISSILRLDCTAEALADRRYPAAVGDAEALPFAEGAFDLIVSALHLHWVDDLPGALAQIRRALKPDGLMMASLLGGDTLVELREALTAAEVEITGGASPRVAPFADLRSTGALLQRAGFALPVIDMDRRVVRYASALDLMRDLRAMGATNALLDRNRRPLRRTVLTRAGEIYAERFADGDGRIPATFEVISLSGWSPHESQQQPLRPGSAKTRLADALRTTEKPAGEKAKR